MSTRYNNGSHYENHQRAAELHDAAAHAHRTGAEQHGKQDHQRTMRGHSLPGGYWTFRIDRGRRVATTRGA